MDRQIKILMTFVLVAIALSYNTEAATTIVAPAANGQVTGSSYLLDVTETGTDLITNVTWDYQLGSGAWVHIGSDDNETAQDAQFNLTWDTTTITDQGAVTINVSAFTGDGTSTIFDSTTVAGVDIDNTVPTSTYGSSTPSNNYVSENQTITFSTASDASLVNCTLTTTPALNGTSSFLVDASSNICTTDVTITDDYTYSYYWTTRDSLNSSTASTRYITIDTSEGYIAPTEELIKIGGVDKEDKTIILVLVAFVIIALLWNQSKKK